MTGAIGDGGAAARERLRADLLGWGEDRPVPPVGVAGALRAQIEDGLQALGDVVGRAAGAGGRGTVVVTRARLARTVCDGWALAPRPAEHDRATVRGILAHQAISRDLDAGGGDEVVAVVDAAWHELAARRPDDPRSVSAWLNGRDVGDATRLRGEAADLVATFREVWPAPPADVVTVRTGARFDVALADGAVRLAGVVDVVVDSVQRDDRARALVVDLRTGLLRPVRDRDELRFLALVATLATGRVPFRWATLHVAEGRPEIEDLDLARLRAAADRVVEVVAQSARIAGLDEHAAVEELRPGEWCVACGRRETCPATS